MPTKRNLKTLEIDSWRTPWTGIKAQTVGDARLQRSYYQKHLYPMEGVRGYDFFRITKRITVIGLQRRFAGRWDTWMVDDPIHWYGMKELCDRLPVGRILCAGLGLGLMVHHLTARTDITEVKIIEIDPDVIALISPHLPLDPRVIVQQGDYYEAIQHLEHKPDAILWDLAVGSHPETTHAFLGGALMTHNELPGVPFYQFGLKGIDNYLDLGEPWLANSDTKTSHP